jgi:hypothetical protein
MIGYRARLGFLLPPGNPTIKPEMIAMCPQGVPLHFNRMVARGAPGALDGQAERNSRYRRFSAIRYAQIEEPVSTLLSHFARGLRTAALGPSADTTKSGIPRQRV